MLKIKKLLTIAIPTWNREKYLKELLTELITQVLQFELQDKIEILISDNASTDKTWDLISKFSSEYNFFNIQRNDTNLGAKTNVILSLARSRTDFTILIGDDDRIRNDSLPQVLNQILKCPDCNFIIDQSRSKFKSSSLGNMDLVYILKNYYWYMGNAGCFIVNTKYIPSILNEYGLNYFNECWPQTQLMILSAIKNKDSPILVHNLDISIISRHDEVMIYTSYYLWRTCVIELHLAINEIKSHIPSEVYYASRNHLRKIMIQNFFNIMQCGIFIDDIEKLKLTRNSIFKNLKILSIPEIFFYGFVGFVFFLPKSLAQPLSNLFIFITRGKNGLKKKNDFVKNEIVKKEIEKLNIGAIRSLTFERKV